LGGGVRGSKAKTVAGSKLIILKVVWVYLKQHSSRKVKKERRGEKNGALRFWEEKVCIDARAGKTRGGQLIKVLEGKRHRFSLGKL